MPDEQRTTEIERRIDRDVTGALAIMPHGGGSLVVAPRNMTEVMEVAKLMSVSGICIRPMFRGNPGSCLAIVLQAMKWGADPFAVANKAFEVNGQLSYESQLIHAIINASPALGRRLQVTYSGEGQTRCCHVIGFIKGDDDPKPYDSPRLGEITPKNSPLWKSDPDQQLFYYATRAWARRWLPEILLGIYVPEELTTIDLEPQPPVQSKLERFEEKHGEPPSHGEDSPAPIEPSTPEDTRQASGPGTPLPNAAAPAASDQTQGAPAWSPAPASTEPEPSPDDEKLKVLVKRGDEAAQQGTPKLESLWRYGFSSLDRGILGARGRGTGPYLERWKKIAAEADARLAAQSSPAAVIVQPQSGGDRNADEMAAGGASRLVCPQGDFCIYSPEECANGLSCRRKNDAPAPDLLSADADRRVPRQPVPPQHAMGMQPAAEADAGDGRPDLEVKLPVYHGQPLDWRSWWIALFLPKLAQQKSGTDLGDFIGANGENLDQARAALGENVVNDALHEKWREFDG